MGASKVETPYFFYFSSWKVDLLKLAELLNSVFYTFNNL